MPATIRRLYAIYFSPSGSTEKVVKRIAEGFEGLTAESIDLLPQLIGAVTFGNSYYGIALTELKERAESRGFRVAALGAFVARHSLDVTIGEGRPDSEDLRIIDDFARKSCAKILGGDCVLHSEPKTGWSSSEQANNLIAYRETHRNEPYALPPSYKAKTITDDCIKCKTCVRHCPVDAIDLEAKTFDLEACIGCWGCINRCPKHAMIYTSQEMADIMWSAKAGFSKRLEPEIFI